MGLETKEPSKPRRTRGTYSYKFRNYFATTVLGVALLSGIIWTQPSENLVNSFINNARDSTKVESEEPTAKKLKKSNSIEIQKEKIVTPKEKQTSSANEEQDLDDSLKFFKVATTNFKKCHKSTNSSVASTSTLVTAFLNESKPKIKTVVGKTRKPATKKTTKKSKTQPDIRKAISKREKLFNHVLTENCQKDGLDPDEVQMALAISESMIDPAVPSTSDSSLFDNPFNSGNGKVQSISTVLERYGFKCKKNYTEYELGLITNTKLNTKKSRFMKLPTELTRTTTEKREEMIRLRVMDIMDENHSQTVDNIFDDKFSYEVSSFYLQEFHEKVHTTFKVSSDDRPTDDTLMLYYVQHLFEPSFLKADHLLKDWKKIPGREATPDKDAQSELYGVTQTSSLKRMLLTRSCSDLFADSSDIANYSDFDDSDDICETPLDENSEELEKVLAKEVSLVENDSVDLTQMEISRIIQGDNKVDLTQNESADETSTTIPIDDSFFSLQTYLKKLEAREKASKECKLEQQTLNRRDNISIIQINLLSSDEEETPNMGTVVISSSEGTVVMNNAENAQNIEEDLFDVPEELNFVCTNNSHIEDEESEAISDEEINYSIRKFYSYKDCHASQESQESQESQVNEIIPTTAPNEDEVFFELENWRNDVFGDSMTVENDFDINDSVMGLLETSVIPEVLNKKDHSTRFHDSEILSESIREILKKYQDPKVEESSSRSLRKMQSDTNLLNQSNKQRKSVHFNFIDDFNESINNPPAALEDSFTWRLNNSLHEPLNDSIENNPCLPVAALKKIKPSASKTEPRISLGIAKCNDYIIDASRKFPDPDFHSMTPVELKQQLFKIGVRPLPVKKAIELLEYIYEQLHPQIRIAADEEIDVNDSRRLMNATDIITNINVLDSDDFVFTPGLVEDEDYVLPKMRKTKIPTCKIPLHISFYNMVRSNEKLQKYILEYRPIELDQAYKHFRKFGITYQLTDIIAFLDKRCITFKTKDNGIQQARVKKKEKRAQQRSQKNTQQSQFPA
ncbi:unnamed protein product [Diamesa serratosioi]